MPDKRVSKPTECSSTRIFKSTFKRPKVRFRRFRFITIFTALCKVQLENSQFQEKSPVALDRETRALGYNISLIIIMIIMIIRIFEIERVASV